MTAALSGVPQSGPARPSAPARDDVVPLRVVDVTVRFGAIAALTEVSLLVEPGTVHAVIGPNGAGKSTLFNVLSGVYRADSGQVWLGDQELTALRPHQIASFGVGRAFQNIVLSPQATVAQSLMLGRHRLTRTGFLAAGLGLPSARRETAAHLARVREIAEFFDLGELFDARVGELSYGDRKRVEIARAVATEPRIVLLDEPVAGMNAAESRRMAALLLETRAALGISVLLVEHDMSVVMGVADRVTVLDFGRVIADGAPAQIQSNPDVLRAYLGTRAGDQANSPAGSLAGSRTDADRTDSDADGADSAL